MEGLEAKVGGWTAAMKTEEGREHFLESGDLQEAACTFNEAVDASRSPQLLVPLTRLLRNCVPLGPPAVEALLQADVASTACRLICASLPEAPAAPAAAVAAAPTQALAEPAAEVVEAALQLLAAAAQLLANLANSGVAGAAAVWAAGWPRALLRLVAHPAGKLHDPAALVLYACCRQRYSCSLALVGMAGSSGSSGSSSIGIGSSSQQGAGLGADAAAARAVWDSLLERQLQEHRRQAEGSGGPREGGHQASAQQWTSLLVGCVALRQGLLQPLLRLLSTGGCSSSSSSPTAVAASGFLCPLLLHLLAGEMQELKGGLPVDLGFSVDPGSAPSDGRHEDVDPRPAAASGGALAQLQAPARPLCAALLCAAEVAVEAARECARRGASSTGSTVGSGSSGGGAQGAGGAQGQQEPRQRPAPLEAVLEAALEVLKSVAQREDGGRPLSGGLDLAEWLLLADSSSGASSSSSSSSSGGDGVDAAAAPVTAAGAAAAAAPVTVAARLLGMLAALQPAAAARNKARSALPPPMVVDLRTGAAEAAPPPPEPQPPTHAAAAAGVGAGPGAGGAPQDRPVVELPAALEQLAVGFPAGASATPYIGYRGDLVAVVANGCFRRPAVTSAVVRFGGLELLLAQTHLDERSPLAREWALWGVRNMAEGSEEVRSRIAGLELQTTVDTPELQQLGLRLELDKGTGKMKVTKTAEAEELIKHSATPAPQ